MIADGVNNLFDTSMIKFDVRRDKRSYYWFSSDGQFYVEDDYPFHQPDTWFSDDTTGHDEEDNDPWHSNLEGHLYGADYPGFQAEWYTDFLWGGPWDGGAQKLNMKEWVRCVLGGGEAETIQTLTMSGAFADGTLASDAYTWHSFACVVSNATGFARCPSNNCENEITTGNIFWGMTPSW
jgi:hypothetical protein